jgi:hypothetical protein
VNGSASPHGQTASGQSRVRTTGGDGA